MFAYCRERAAAAGTPSRSPATTCARRARTAVQEIAFTLAERHRVRAGRDRRRTRRSTSSRPRLSFFFACHINFFEEVAKFRAARRMWARIMKERFGAKDPRSPDAPVPHADRRRHAHRAAAGEQHRPHGARGARGGAGGTQSLHTNSFDEALVAAHRAGGADRAADPAGARRTRRESPTPPTPSGGSWFIESLTDELEEHTQALLDQVDELGGAVAAIETGWMKREIEESAYRIAQTTESGERVVVGVNRFTDEAGPGAEILALDPELQAQQWERLERLRKQRDQHTVDAALKKVEETARGTSNLLPSMREALALHATLGEVSDALRQVFGEYEPGSGG